MAKKKGWFNDPRSVSEPPPSGRISEPPPGSDGHRGMWARSEPPGSLGTPSGAEIPAQDYGMARERTSPQVSNEPPEAQQLTEPDKAVEAPAGADEAGLATQSSNGASEGATPKLTARAETQVTAEPAERTTTIGKTVVIRGKLTSAENLIVQGRIEAEINSSKDLHLEESGVINADMKIKSVTLSGVAVGDIHAKELVKLAPAARVVGDIYTPRLVVEDGATFRGRVEMDGLEHLESVKPKQPAEATSSSNAAGGSSGLSTAKRDEATDAADGASTSSGETLDGAPAEDATEPSKSSSENDSEDAVVASAGRSFGKRDWFKQED